MADLQGQENVEDRWYQSVLNLQRMDKWTEKQFWELYNDSKVFENKIPLFETKGLMQAIVAAVSNGKTEGVKEAALELLNSLALADKNKKSMFQTVGLIAAVNSALQSSNNHLKPLSTSLLCKLAIFQEVQDSLCSMQDLVTTVVSLTIILGIKGVFRDDALMLLIQLAGTRENRKKLLETMNLLQYAALFAKYKSLRPRKFHEYARILLGLLALNDAPKILHHVGQETFSDCLRNALSWLGVDVPLRTNQDTLLELLKEADAGVDVNRRLLVLVTGAPEAGKTSLVHTLKNSLQPAPSPLSTIGVEFSEFQLPTYDETPLELTVFDMAGQHEYGVLHAMFGSQRSLVLLAVDLSTFPDPSHPNWESIFKQRVQYYVDKTVSNAKARMQLVVVGTKVDAVEGGSEVARSRLNSIYEKLVQHEEDILADIEVAMHSSRELKRIAELQHMLDIRPMFWEQIKEGLLPTGGESERTSLRNVLLVSSILADQGNAQGFDELHRWIVSIAKAHGQRLLKRHAKLRLEIISALKMAGAPLQSIKLEAVLGIAEEAGFTLPQGESSHDPRKRAIQDLHDLGHLVWFHDSPALQNQVFDRQALVDTAKDLVRHDLKRQKLREWFKNRVAPHEIDGKVSLLSRLGIVKVDDIVAAFPSWHKVSQTEAMHVISILEYFRIVVRVGKKRNLLFIPQQVVGPILFESASAPVLTNPLSGFSVRAVWTFVGFAPPHLIEQLATSICEMDPRFTEEGHFSWKFVLHALIGYDVLLGSDKVPISFLSVKIFDKQVQALVNSTSENNAGLGLGWVAGAINKVFQDLTGVANVTHCVCDEKFNCLAEWSKVEEAVRHGEESIRLFSEQFAFVKHLYVPTMPWDADFNFLAPLPAPSNATLTSSPLLHCIFASPLVRRGQNGDVFYIDQLDVFSEAQRICTEVRSQRDDVDIKFVWGRADKAHDAFIKMGPGVVLIGAHCTRDLLVLEDVSGSAHFVDLRTLYSVLKSAIRAKGAPRLVLLNSCHSAEIGKCFLAAGVPHVVAYDTDHDLSDTQAKTFSKMFFSSLAAGATIRDAFENGRGAVRLQSDERLRDDANHYLLLPPLGDHEEQVWKSTTVKGGPSVQTHIPPYLAVLRDDKPLLAYAWTIMNALTNENKHVIFLRGNDVSQLARFVRCHIQARLGKDFFSGGVFWGSNVYPLPAGPALDQMVFAATLGIFGEVLGVVLQNSAQELFAQAEVRFGMDEALIVLDQVTPPLTSHATFLSAIGSVLKRCPNVRFILVMTSEVVPLAEALLQTSVVEINLE